MKPVVAVLCALAGLALTGCGIKGPLYLPEKSSEIVIRPAPESKPPASAPPAGQPPPPADETGPPRE